MSLATSASGTQSLTLRLEPNDLGTVQVRIDRPIDAPAHVDVSVSRPETLTLLLRDQAQLQHTLDQAGVPAEGRTLSLHLAGQGTDSQSRQAGAFDQSTRDGRAPRLPNQGGTATGNASNDAAASLAPTIATRWQRVGLDITA
jgi:flagellar hook-length control protein FliK